MKYNIDQSFMSLRGLGAKWGTFRLVYSALDNLTVNFVNISFVDLIRNFVA